MSKEQPYPIWGNERPHLDEPYHIWGDDWPHWDKLYAAELFIYKYVYKYSFFRLSSKEKWGTLRYEWLWGPGDARFGPYIKIRGKIVWVWKLSYVYNLWRRYAKWILNKAIKKAINKWPEIKEEILSDYDPEYL